MPRIQSVLVPMLACVVSLASISCACAAPVPEPAGGPAPHHVHQPDSDVSNDAECVDSGCGGNGGFDSILPEGFRAAAPETPFDDGADIAPALAGLSHSPTVVFNPPMPPPGLWRALPTPVSRFDRLLN